PAGVPGSASLPRRRWVAAPGRAVYQRRFATGRDPWAAHSIGRASSGYIECGRSAPGGAGSDPGLAMGPFDLPKEARPMGILRDFERRLETMVEGFFARALPGGGVQPVELGKRMVRAMEEQKT